ncbi:MAG: MATE family efflux transporter [Lachnospiraceae bacterium]|nr:MATE family efflux transporter [Lachnospiraceae bacterium]
MTEGDPLKLILQFAFPLLLGNLFQQTYNIVDAAIVGQALGAKALAGVGASSSVQFLIMGFCIGLCAGFAVPVAQRFGAGDMKSLRRYVFHGTLLVIIFSVVLTLACTLACNNILRILRTPEDIYDNAYIYLFVLFCGIPFTLLYNTAAGFLRSVGDSRTPFIFLAVSTVANIGLDLYCITVLKWGIFGAAIATVASQATSGILCLIYILVKMRFIIPKTEDLLIKGSYFATLLNMGLPMGMQYSITAIGSMVMQSANNSLGSVYVSGFTAGMKIKQFTMCPFDALATAAATFCSQNYGAGNVLRIKKGLKIGLILAVSYGIFAGLLLILFGRPASMLFVSRDSTAVLDASAKYLRALGFFYWSLGILGVTRMVTQGLGFSMLTILSGFTEMVARILMSLFAVPAFGYDAIVFTDQSAWLSACFYIVPVCLFCINRIEKLLRMKAEQS